jgi:hypothetical protein
MLGYIEIRDLYCIFVLYLETFLIKNSFIEAEFLLKINIK